MVGALWTMLTWFGRGYQLCRGYRRCREARGVEDADAAVVVRCEFSSHRSGRYTSLTAMITVVDYRLSFYSS